LSTATLPAQIARAYRAMAALGHRPLASENAEHMADANRLEGEARAFTDEFLREDALGTFAIGCADDATTVALVFTIEAARCMCAGRVGDAAAAALLQAAAAELARVRRKREQQVSA
jgi:hypothetical protein